MQSPLHRGRRGDIGERSERRTAHRYTRIEGKSTSWGGRTRPTGRWAVRDGRMGPSVFTYRMKCLGWGGKVHYKEGKGGAYKMKKGGAQRVFTPRPKGEETMKTGWDLEEI